MGAGLNHDSNLGQNLASGGALLPICAVFMFLSFGPQYAADWARVGINVLTSMVSLLLCYAIFGLIRDRNNGHRWLHVYMLAAFACLAGVKGWLAWKWLFNASGHLPLVFTVIQDTALIVFGVFFYTTRHDLQITYQRSEEQRRANLHRIEQAHQAAVLVEYRVQESLNSSQRPKEFIANVGRGR